MSSNELLLQELNILTKKRQIEQLEEQISSLDAQIQKTSQLIQESDQFKGTKKKWLDDIVKMGAARSTNGTPTSTTSSSSSAAAGQSSASNNDLHMAEAAVAKLQRLISREQKSVQELRDKMESSGSAPPCEEDIQDLLAKYTTLTSSLQKRREELKYTGAFPPNLEAIKSHIATRIEYFNQLEAKIEQKVAEAQNMSTPPVQR